jgi:hypothetical protein
MLRMYRSSGAVIKFVVVASLYSWVRYVRKALKYGHVESRHNTRGA